MVHLTPAATGSLLSLVFTQARLAAEHLLTDLFTQQFLGISSVPGSVLDAGVTKVFMR